jgi:hypothetical protein
MRCVGLVVCMREKRNAYKILVRIPEGKGLLGILRCSWEGNNKMDLK